jgi:hypothetical protein
MIIDFKHSIDAWVKATNKTMHQGIAETAIRLGTMIIEKTPIDIGRAKGNWLGAFDDPDTTVDDDRRQEQAITGLRLKFTASNVAKHSSIFVTNSLPYIKALEDGHSQIQAPNGMVRLSVSEFPAILQREINNAKRV